MRRLFFIAFFLMFAFGCNYVSKEVVLLSIDISNVQRETSDALVKSIDAEIQERSDDLSPEKLKSLEDLKERLIYLKRGNHAIMRSFSSNLSMVEISQLNKKRQELQGTEGEE